MDKIIINEAHNTNNILENNNKLDLIENHKNSKEISSSVLNEIFEKEEIGAIESKDKIQKEKNILIRDVNIKFPFEPYTEQIKYMEQILLCLESKEEYPNALLESPTGTGKTLSLLCSIFAWNENRIKKSLSSKRIIYCTRTTSQINNLMNELKKINNLYNPTTCILCSREKICPNENLLNKAKEIHNEEEKDEMLEEIEKEEEKNKSIIDIDTYDIYNENNNEYSEEIDDEEEITIDQICKKFKEENNCPYYKKDDDFINDIPEYLDIEDLKLEAENKYFCPLYYLRQKIEIADIIFMSYNYIFNDIFRYIMKIGPLLEDSIIIVDEAHNILSLCEDSKTRAIDYKNIVGAIEKINGDSKDKKNEKKFDNEENLEEKNNKIPEIKQYILEYLEIVKDSLFQLFEENKIILKKNEYCIIEKKILLNLFDSDIFEEIIIVIDKYLKFLNKKFCTNKNLKKIKDFISFLKSIQNQNDDDYMFNLSFIESKAKSKNKNNNENINFRINIFCFNPSLEFGEILSFKPYRIILTSGTLSPLNYFESQLNHSFYFKYQGNNIINEDNLLFKIITNYSLPKENPTNKQKHTFYFGYETWNLDFQYKILGYLLIDLCHITPGGILIFFTSFQKLKDCLSIWINEGIYEKINSIKTIFNENSKYKKEKNLNDPFCLFKKNIDEERGGILMSVFRGKISEGINFKNNYARMLINVGIPFINNSNVKFNLKKAYLENKNEDFNQWYKNDAIFAMNQSSGRIIRDKNDYGVILNIDKRNKDYLDLFSGWLKKAEPKFEEYKCNLNENYESNINNNLFIQEIENFYKKKNMVEKNY